MSAEQIQNKSQLAKESCDEQKIQTVQPSLDERIDSLQRDLRRLINIVTKLEQHSHSSDGRVVIPFGMWTP